MSNFDNDQPAKPVGKPITLRGAHELPSLPLTDAEKEHVKDVAGNGVPQQDWVKTEFSETHKHLEPGEYSTDERFMVSTISPNGYSVEKTVIGRNGFAFNREQKEYELRNAIEIILAQFPINTADENFSGTPGRVAKAMVNELFVGYFMNVDDVLKTFPNSHHEDEVVVENDIPFFSTCAHHLLPFFGKASIAYLPDKKVLGLSKFARVLEIFSRRMTLQEHITKQVAESLNDALHPQGIMVVLHDVMHTCTCSRGARAVGSTTSTSIVKGKFRDVPILRQEAMALMHLR